MLASWNGPRAWRDRGHLIWLSRDRDSFSLYDAGSDARDEYKNELVTACDSDPESDYEASFAPYTLRVCPYCRRTYSAEALKDKEVFNKEHKHCIYSAARRDAQKKAAFSAVVNRVWRGAKYEPFPKPSPAALARARAAQAAADAAEDAAMEVRPSLSRSAFEYEVYSPLDAFKYSPSKVVLATVVVKFRPSACRYRLLKMW